MKQLERDGRADPGFRATYSPRQSTRVTGFGITHTYDLLRRDVMPHIKVGKKYYIPKAALEEWLRTCGGPLS